MADSQQRPTHRLTPHQHDDALRMLRRFGLSTRTEAELLAEIEERTNAAACYLADLEVATDPLDRARLDGGAACEAAWIDALMTELRRRARAVKHGYRPNGEKVDPDLPSRFA